MKTQTVLESANVVIDDARDFSEFSIEEEIDKFINEPTEKLEEAYVSDTTVATSGPSVPTDHESDETDYGEIENKFLDIISEVSHEAESVQEELFGSKKKVGVGFVFISLDYCQEKIEGSPLSPSSSESEPEEAKSELKKHDTTLSDESVPDNAESEAESNGPEQEDVVPTEQEAESETEPVATPFSSKAKGKRPISDSTPSQRLSGVNFKPHSLIFCYNDNARDMVLYAQRKFLIEKNHVLSDHRPFGVLTMLPDRKWTGSLVKFTGLVDRIVKEFYANITDEIIDPKSPLYCKVYVRGHWSSFSPQDIAQALHLPLDVENDDDLDSPDKDEVITELVGQKMVWLPNTVILVTNLTYTYVVLHKFATTNWKPTSHTASISFDMASFLYKVGTRIAVDAPSSKKAKPQSLTFSSDDNPPVSSSIPIDSGPVSIELAAV
ncbi:uncharacterized protein LOC133779313 [Humulus lupulus]|uniref:uncharacterized protein LOC133779313 n=1 Tax=Humulus lupulus TaxID=3486 RepID=UPI002B404703|nr:uncharacterized protein LOC133779313 [Humulus lupulus]